MNSITAREFQRTVATLTEVTEVNGGVWVPKEHPLNATVRALDAGIIRVTEPVVAPDPAFAAFRPAPKPVKRSK